MQQSISGRFLHCVQNYTSLLQLSLRLLGLGEISINHIIAAASRRGGTATIRWEFTSSRIATTLLIEVAANGKQSLLQFRHECLPIVVLRESLPQVFDQSSTLVFVSSGNPSPKSLSCFSVWYAKESAWFLRSPSHDGLCQLSHFVRLA